jgi:hypothetical protein
MFIINHSSFSLKYIHMGFEDFFETRDKHLDYYREERSRAKTIYNDYPHPSSDREGDHLTG